MGTKPEIDHGGIIDWGKTSKDYAKYRDIYPKEFYERIAAEGLCVSGQTVLDLGTGTGVLPRHMFHYGAEFIGADISENQIAEARRLSAEQGMDIPYIVASAEELEFPDHSFDVITASMCFFYFDIPVVVPRLHRMLKPGGRLLILYMTYMPDAQSITSKSEELVLKYNPAWTGGGMKRVHSAVPPWSKDLFEAERLLEYDIGITFTRDSWHGRMKACRGIGASTLTEEKIAAFDHEHRAFLDGVKEPFTIPHFVNMIILKKKS
jgi:SAM-dependent methyltransferase